MVAAGDVRQRLVAGIAARDGFAAPMRRQLWRAAEQHKGSWNQNSTRLRRREPGLNSAQPHATA